MARGAGFGGLHVGVCQRLFLIWRCNLLILREKTPACGKGSHWKVIAEIRSTWSVRGCNTYNLVDIHKYFFPSTVHYCLKKSSEDYQIHAHCVLGTHPQIWILFCRRVLSALNSLSWDWKEKLKEWSYINICNLVLLQTVTSSPSTNSAVTQSLCIENGLQTRRCFSLGRNLVQTGYGGKSIAHCNENTNARTTFLSSNKNCTSKRILWFAMYFLHRSFWKKLLLGKNVLTSGFKMEQQLSGIKLPVLWFPYLNFYSNMELSPSGLGGI